MHVVEMTIYEAAGGREGIEALANAWHERCLADDVVAHAFSHGFHPEHTQRLATYWCEALGGPKDYTSRLGDESMVIRMHAGNGEHQEMDDRAIACFVDALDDVGFSNDERLRSTLERYFRWSISTMSSFPNSADDVPPGRAIARWSWDGPV